MQTLVIFYKEDKRVVATFKLENAVFGAQALLPPSMSYLFTFTADIFRYNDKGEVFVKEL